VLAAGNANVKGGSASDIFIGTSAGHVIRIRSKDTFPIYRSAGGRGPSITNLVTDTISRRVFFTNSDGKVCVCVCNLECNKYLLLLLADFYVLV
jgi:hypothetical protein